jgi:hypothetical protein
MTNSDLLAPFDDEVIRAVASENDVEEELLRDALADHQQTMRDTPGVEDLVYEWRKQFDDPMLGQSEQTYFVAVRETVWDEYGSYLDLDDYLLSALAAVHQEQVLRTSELDLAGMKEGSVPIVVGRPD